MSGPRRTRPSWSSGCRAGIAAYKAVEVCRRLVDAGIHVAPVLTERATRFVGKATFDALGSEPAQTSLWDEASPIPHTRLGQRADLIVVAPATADLLARYAGGLRRRPAHRHPGGHRRPGGGLPGHAHRDVGAPGRPAQPGRAPVPRGHGGPARGRAAWPAGTSGPGRLAEPSVIVGHGARRCWAMPVRRAATGGRRPGRRAGGGVGRRHPRAHRPGPVHHQPLVGQAGPRPGRRRPAAGAPRWCWSPPALSRWPPGWSSTGWRRRPTWRRPCSTGPTGPTW